MHIVPFFSFFFRRESLVFLFLSLNFRRVDRIQLGLVKVEVSFTRIAGLSSPLLRVFFHRTFGFFVFFLIDLKAQRS